MTTLTLAEVQANKAKADNEYEEARKAYEEARKAYDKAIEARYEARKAYNNAIKAHNEAEGLKAEPTQEMGIVDTVVCTTLAVGFITALAIAKKNETKEPRKSVLDDLDERAAKAVIEIDDELAALKASMGIA